MNTIEKRRSFIINIVYFTFLIGLFYLFFKYAFGICAPFILALFLATVLQRPVNWMVKKAHVNRGFISTIFVILGFLFCGIILVFVVLKLFNEIRGLFDYLSMKLENAPLLIAQIREWFQNNLTFIPTSIRSTISESIGQVIEKVVGSSATVIESQTTVEGAAPTQTDWSWLASPLGAVWGTAKQIPMFAVGIVVAIVSCCFMTADFKTLRDMILTQAGEENSVKIIRSKRILFSTLGKMGKAYAILIAVTFTEMMIGLSFLKLIGLYTGGYVFAIALVTAIVDILPVLGTGTILIPWGVWSLCTGNIGFGIGILIVYAVILVVRQILEPKLVASQLGLPAFVTIIAMYMGTQLFGFIGLFLLPISIVLLKVLNDEGVINVLKRKPVSVQEINEELSHEKNSAQDIDDKKDKKTEKKHFFKKK